MNKIWVMSFVAMIILTGCTSRNISKNNESRLSVQSPLKEFNGTDVKKYDPKIDPADFSSSITNKYFTLTPGMKYTYVTKTVDGIERDEIYITKEIKAILGVNTTIVWDRVWFNDELIEETYDWYAQDNDGNVWYFGEDSREILDGQIVSTKGSWEAGKDGAKPGIIMEADPEVNDTYRQEYYSGKAEDMAEISSLSETVSVPYGNFSDCLKTRDWTPLEQGSEEYKFYCDKIGGVVLEVAANDGEKTELVNITYNPNINPVGIQTSVNIQKNITEEKAKEIALSKVNGSVTDVEIERKYGMMSYVIQIDANNGTETDVIIDIGTGEVFGIET